MDYKDAIKRFRGKLYCWGQSDEDGYFEFYDSTTGTTLYVNVSDYYFKDEGLIQLTKINDSSFPNICNLEDRFEDPSCISKEEAALFKLEYGFDYPKELISDL